ncbi:MAG: hypothetical protein BJ554DRAFT_3462, partial [Olpidium bornovanus]
DVYLHQTEGVEATPAYAHLVQTPPPDTAKKRASKGNERSLYVTFIARRRAGGGIGCASWGSWAGCHGTLCTGRRQSLCRRAPVRSRGSPCGFQRCNTAKNERPGRRYGCADANRARCARGGRRRAGAVCEAVGEGEEGGGETCVLDEQGPRGKADRRLVSPILVRARARDAPQVSCRRAHADNTYRPSAYSDAGGGGERVLWTVMRALQRECANAAIVIYTGDVSVSKDEILRKAKTRFDISVDGDALDVVYLHKRALVEDSRCVKQRWSSLAMGVSGRDRPTKLECHFFVFFFFRQVSPFHPTWSEPRLHFSQF